MGLLTPTLRFCSVSESGRSDEDQWADQTAQRRAQICSVSKKRQGLSTNTEGARQDVAEEIRYVGGSQCRPNRVALVTRLVRIHVTDVASAARPCEIKVA